MAETLSDLQAELETLRARRTKIAGIRSTAFSDQSTAFDHESLDRRIADIEQQIARLSGATSTRYAASRKGA